MLGDNRRSDHRTRLATTEEGTVPLSEHEQRLLEQIEQGLYAEDPKFASAVRRVRKSGGTRRRVILGVLGAVLGLAIVLVALLTNVIIVSVLGFVLIVASCAYAVTRSGGRSANSGPLGIVDGDRVRSRRQSGMKERMEDRIRRRFDEE
jgi:Flp pilus assembly protein TadB